MDFIPDGMEVPVITAVVIVIVLIIVICIVKGFIDEMKKK